MRTITYDGTEYRCPFSTSFRRHTATELDAMRESIAAQGVLNPVRIYYDLDTDDAFCILDGEGRLTVAIELGAAVPFLDMGPLETEAAYAIAKTLNDARRHDDPAAIAARRAERIQRVAQARSEGQSTRAIAEAEGVSQMQVRRDLEESSGETEVSPDVEEPPEEPAEEAPKKRTVAETVKGRDGKDYPLTRKKPSPPPPGQSGFVDAAGQEVPKHLRDLFAPLFLVEVIDYLKQQQKVINDAKSWLHWLKPETHPTLAQLIRYLEDAIPHEVCRHCEGQMNGCIWCMTSGYHPLWSVEAGQNDADADAVEPEPQPEPEPPTKPGRGKRGAA
jgi:hypothetical protein